ncbi:MAG: hypothetical protein A2621_01110 [Alphaproteobacteria bacterium RIFCSPHIGHO2_01_FULL_41_14]|nr:MAG: hypothetical protein A2065_00255 [Alphaproteobacteria bacterium GWB1_45_5]OFW76222.1 MAG: hypothetical protein A3K20_01675 [Alphaproteobacteria bacterium GWA1_45_9]OFW89509.1 MAG: hypothetical protein A2621_01110 [Alphaproteobacteria bacterium RIFCSPHIGHO2_01_FULL_41_14]HCI48242.1 hypothetical protein [Holosporales bacterium]
MTKKILFIWSSILIVGSLCQGDVKDTQKNRGSLLVTYLKRGDISCQGLFEDKKRGRASVIEGVFDYDLPDVQRYCTSSQPLTSTLASVPSSSIDPKTPEDQILLQLKNGSLSCQTLWDNRKIDKRYNFPKVKKYCSARGRWEQIPYERHPQDKGQRWGEGNWRRVFSDAPRREQPSVSVPSSRNPIPFRRSAVKASFLPPEEIPSPQQTLPPSSSILPKRESKRSPTSRLDPLTDSPQIEERGMSLKAVDYQIQQLTAAQSFLINQLRKVKGREHYLQTQMEIFKRHSTAHQTDAQSERKSRLIFEKALGENQAKIRSLESKNTKLLERMEKLSHLSMSRSSSRLRELQAAQQANIQLQNSLQQLEAGNKATIEALQSELATLKSSLSAAETAKGEAEEELRKRTAAEQQTLEENRNLSRRVAEMKKRRAQLAWGAVRGYVKGRSESKKDYSKALRSQFKSILTTVKARESTLSLEIKELKDRLSKQETLLQQQIKLNHRLNGYLQGRKTLKKKVEEQQQIISNLQQQLNIPQNDGPKVEELRRALLSANAELTAMTSQNIDFDTKLTNLQRQLEVVRQSRATLDAQSKEQQSAAEKEIEDLRTQLEKEKQFVRQQSNDLQKLRDEVTTRQGQEEFSIEELTTKENQIASFKRELGNQEQTLKLKESELQDLKQKATALEQQNQELEQQYEHLKSMSGQLFSRFEELQQRTGGS